MPPSRIFENRIREMARRLEKVSSHILHCHVVVERPHQSKTQGDLFDVMITLTVPGASIVVSRSHSNDPKHSDAYVALRDSFNAAKRRLQEHERVMRGEVKAHTVAIAQEVAGSASASA